MTDKKFMTASMIQSIQFSQDAMDRLDELICQIRYELKQLTLMS